MKITFDNDDEANEFFRTVIRGLYGVGVAMAGTPVAVAMNKAGDDFSVAYFSHYRERIALGDEVIRARTGKVGGFTEAIAAGTAAAKKPKARKEASLLET